MTEKYFSYCIEAGTMGNWTEMIPGMIDVRIYKSYYYSSNSTFCNPFQMSGTLFLKAGGWEFARLHTKHNPGNAWWYSFDYRSRFTILGMDDMFPPGNTFPTLFN